MTMRMMMMMMTIITIIHPAELSGSQSTPYWPDVLPRSTLCLPILLILTNIDELWSKAGNSDPRSGELPLMSCLCTTGTWLSRPPQIHQILFAKSYVPIHGNSADQFFLLKLKYTSPSNPLQKGWSGWCDLCSVNPGWVLHCVFLIYKIVIMSTL